MSSSCSSINSKIPRVCKCREPLPLKQRTSWTINNPCRRFMACTHSLIPWKRCKAWYWVDDEVNSEWYKLNLYELYQSLNRDQRESYYEMMNYRQMYTKMEDEFGLYKSEMEETVGLLQVEVLQLKKKYKFMVKLCVFLVAVLVLVLLF